MTTNLFRSARLKLTFFYSVLFLFFLWLFSLGIFFSMSRALNDGYIARIRERSAASSAAILDPTQTTVALVAGSVALEQLRNVLLFLNYAAIVIIPLTSWYLTGFTLNPIQKSNQQQRQFVSDASHELRTPLSIVSGEIELALNKPRSGADYKLVLLSTKEEVDRLARLIENLLFLARSDYTKQSLEFKPVDITDLLNSIISQHSTQLKAQKLQLDISLPNINLQVSGQSSLLQTLFSNLIDNAIKYSPPEGHIGIKISRSGQFVSITVTNFGVGIKSEELPKIFTRFYRTDTSRSSPKGFGLGLAIVKTIVEKHGGRIQVSSDPEKGTSFAVYLPSPPTPLSPRLLKKYLKLKPSLSR